MIKTWSVALWCGPGRGRFNETLFKPVLICGKKNLFCLLFFELLSRFVSKCRVNSEQEIKLGTQNLGRQFRFNSCMFNSSI